MELFYIILLNTTSTFLPQGIIQMLAVQIHHRHRRHDGHGRRHHGHE